MMVKISGLLNKNQLDFISGKLKDAPFVDGLLSAGKAAKRVKNNQELDRSNELNQALNSMVVGALYHHPTFQHAVLPHRISMAFFARYTVGMGYGDHVDNAIMGEGQFYRSDIATTVFLSPPENYDGGELTVNTPFGEQKIKLAAGDAVVYPGSSLHRVAQVTKGERLVAVAWTQSLVRDPGKREILYELSQARDALTAQDPDSAVAEQVDHSYSNLVRMWAEL